MGRRLHAERRLHQGLRLRRQSALPARHGARRDAAGRNRISTTRRARRRRPNIARPAATSPRSRACSSTTPQLERLGQGAASAALRPDEMPDFVFYTGCNVLKTPHIAAARARHHGRDSASPISVMGGPSHCCGVVAVCAPAMPRNVGTHGDEFDRQACRTAKSGVLSWCPSCYRPVSARRRCRRSSGSAATKPFEMTPFLRFLCRADSIDMRAASCEAGRDARRAAPSFGRRRHCRGRARSAAGRARD